MTARPVGDDAELTDAEARGLIALCIADAEHPDAAIQAQMIRARELLDTREPGDGASLEPKRLRDLGLTDEHGRLTSLGRRVARGRGWDPDAGPQVPDGSLPPDEEAGTGLRSIHAP